MEERFAVEGYVVDELIGFGGTGEVWRGHDVSTGDVVALKRLRQRGAAATERIRREGALLASVAGPHVIALRRVIETDDEAVLVMDYAAGGSLAGLLAVRKTLPAAEVVTILAPLAATLAAAHSRELIHGDLTPANVLFGGDGRPLLADFGVARVVGAIAAASGTVEATVDYLDPAVIAGGDVTTASDVYALGAVGYAALSGRSPHGTRPLLAAVAAGTPAGLIVAIESMLSDDPYDRPDARSAQHTILRSGPAAPVGLVHHSAPVAAPVTHPVRIPPPPSEPEPARRRRRLPHRLLVVCIAVLALAAAAALGVGWAQLGSHGRAGALVTVPTAGPSPSPSASSWTTIVTRLEGLRAQAYADGQAGLLAEVYAPSAPAFAADLATVGSLASRGLRADGFSATVEEVSVDSSDATSARLHVVDALSGYTLVDAAGKVAGHGRARPARAFTMTLTKQPDGWRVAAIAPTASSAAPSPAPDS
jgi:eukaryotic-like serine/threonine-protein kinase